MSNKIQDSIIDFMSDLMKPSIEKYCSRYERAVSWSELNQHLEGFYNQSKKEYKRMIKEGSGQYWGDYMWADRLRCFRARVSKDFLVERNAFYYKKEREDKEAEAKELVIKKRKREENVEALLGEIRDLLMEMNDPSQKRLREAMNELDIV